jgi:hypothetical protein
MTYLGNWTKDPWKDKRVVGGLMLVAVILAIGGGLMRINTVLYMGITLMCILWAPYNYISVQGMAQHARNSVVWTAVLSVVPMVSFTLYSTEQQQRMDHPRALGDYSPLGTPKASGPA